MLSDNVAALKNAYAMRIFLLLSLPNRRPGLWSPTLPAIVRLEDTGTFATLQDREIMAYGT